MNSDADLTSVKEYLIPPLEPNNTGDEVVGNEPAEEYVVEYTTQFTNE